MSFDPEAARRAVLPKDEERISQRHERYSQMINDLRISIDASLAVIARQDYRNGGTIRYQSGNFSNRRQSSATPFQNLKSRVAWVISEEFHNNDGHEYYEHIFLDEDRNLTMETYGEKKYPFTFSQLGVIPLFQYDSGEFNGWDVAPRSSYPLRLTHLLKAFCRNGTPGYLENELKLWDEYTKAVRDA